jgi:hypothetical protein
MSAVARTTGSRRILANILLTVLVFVVIGPLVGVLAIFVIVAIGNGGSLGAGVAAFIFFVLIGWPAILMVDGPAAAVTGLIVALASRWIARPWLLYAMAGMSGAITNSCFIYAGLPLVRALVTSREPDDFIARQAGDLALFASLGAITAILCTWLTKRWRSA